MKEMVGGCCVCSDERGWPENPLVYCDGPNCLVAVHQACYGIVTVPTGPWYCRKCESQERPTRLRCELCPSRDGALKRTDIQSWAHVVCALYIPEVRFGNVTTMEPIILQLIPQERYSKVCYICTDLGKGSKANIGACMQCNKSGCKQQFHVTCAQALGLLCEEAGNYLDNVKYCGYCKHHYSKLKKSGNVKTIPPFKPVKANAHEHGSSDPSSSPEKDTEAAASTAAGQSSATVVAAPKAGPTGTTGNVVGSVSSGGVGIAGGGAGTAGTVTSASATSAVSAANTPIISPPNQAQPLSASGASAAKQRKVGSSSSSKTTTTTSAPATAGSGSASSHSASGASGSQTGAGSSAGPVNLSTVNSSNSGNIVNTSTDGSTKEKEKNSKGLSRSASSSSSSSSSKSGKDSRDRERERDRDRDRDRGDRDRDRDRDRGDRDRDRDKHSKSSKSSSASISSSSNNKDGNTDSNTPAIVTNVNVVPKDMFSHKFTTSNFTETILVNSEAVFGDRDGKSTNQPTSNTPNVKKRKLDGKSSSTDDINKDLIKDVSVTLVPLPFDKVDAMHDSKKHKMDSSSIQPMHMSTSNVIQSHTMSKGSPGSILQPSALAVPFGNSASSTTTAPSPLQPTSSSSLVAPSMPAATPTAAAAAAPAMPSSAPTIPTSTVSLVVSVPLSTANVPGITFIPNSTGHSMLNNASHGMPIIKSFSAINADTISNSSTNRMHIVNPNAQQDKVMIEKHNSLAKNSASSPALNKLSAIPDNLGGSARRTASPSGANGSNATTPTITTMESGGIKITYEKQQPPLAFSKSVQDEVCGRVSCTPDDSMNSSSSCLKFTFEAQSNSYATPSQTPDIKESPPSSPASEISQQRGSKRHANNSNSNSSSTTDAKEFKMFQKNAAAHATHMLGNQLNPASSMAQKMSDQLYMEMEAHSVYNNAAGLESASTLIGPTFPGKQLNNHRNQPSQPQGPSLGSILGGTVQPTASGNTPQSLEQLLERQWEQGSQFLMEQAQHFDIASLLSCLYQLRSENVRLEEHVNNLIARRDHLLAVNARLAIPLNQTAGGQPQGQAPSFNHLNGPSESSTRRPVENQNGIDFRHSSSHQINARFDMMNKRNKTENR